ncbi:ATP-binding protein [Actinokineospora spheciospongiae]|uniref:ATP-binding protein n=1 Tax=Actinokineospora spheciospongiae TaxID=909613 RepID=UPI000A01911E|nr:tetratricopeptide repeat protein [Actinokineospora spheciospongiae]
MTGHDRFGEVGGAAPEVGPPLVAREVRNAVSGQADSVVQAASIGAVTINPPADGLRPVPQQLPAAPSGFVGRAGELAELSVVADRAAAGIVVVSALGGSGGIGKTWLALQWAHTHRDRFPDGQLFVDLQGFSPAGRPMPPAVAVRGFLDALGVDTARVPADLHAQVALYRSLVAGRRMLIILDNAAATDQVLPLLPGDTGCTLLVTSRRRLPGLVTAHGANPIHLDVLAPPEARALLIGALGAARAAADPAAVDTLLDLCAGFPLALAIVAARSRTSPEHSLRALASELRDTAADLDAFDTGDSGASLPAVLSWSLHALQPRQRQAFGLLGAAPGPDTGLAAAASLLGTPLAQARRTLTDLQDASLLDRDSDGRWRMHDLVRAYATRTAHDLPEHTRQAALQRVLDHYTHTAHAADRLLYPHRDPPGLDPPVPGAHAHPLPDAAAASAWFDGEHACLLAAQRTADAHHRHHGAWHLAWALDTHHTRRGHRHDRLAVWQAAARAAPDLTARIITHRYLGDAHAELGHHEAGLNHLNQALALARHHPDPTHLPHTHYGLSWAWQQQGDNHRALHHAHRALEAFQALGKPVWEAAARNAVAWHTARLGNHTTARAHGQEALNLIRRHHDANTEAEIHDNLGYIDHQTGNFRQAVEHYQHALTLYRTLGNTYETANTLSRLGSSQLTLGQHRQARTAWQEAVKLYQEQGRDPEATRLRQQLHDL